MVLKINILTITFETTQKLDYIYGIIASSQALCTCIRLFYFFGFSVIIFYESEFGLSECWIILCIWELLIHPKSVIRLTPKNKNSNEEMNKKKCSFFGASLITLLGVSVVLKCII